MDSLSNNSSPAPVGTPQSLQKNANFLTQLEVMMGAVKKEASVLESMKLKLREMEEVKLKYNHLKIKYGELEADSTSLRKSLKDSEQMNMDIRNDMQQLNDLYTTERAKDLDLQQTITRLAQEISGLKMEKDFFMKESQKYVELKKLAKSLKAQVKEARTAADEEKESFARQKNESDATILNLKKSKEEATAHFWNLSEELGKVRKELADTVNKQEEYKLKIQEEKMVASHFKDQLQMLSEDLLQSNHRRIVTAKKDIKEYTKVSSSLQDYRLELINRDNEIQTLADRIKQLEESSSFQSTTLQAKLNALEKINEDAASEKKSLTKEVIKLKLEIEEYSTKHTVNESENRNLRTRLEEIEAMYQQKDIEMHNHLKQLTTQRDEAQYKLQNFCAQLEGVQMQAKVDQARYLEEVQKMKDNEAMLLDETEKLTQELQEKLVRLHSLEAEKASHELNNRNEASGASQIVNTLKTELERRLEDLVQLRNERDTAKEEIVAHTKTIEDLQADRKKKEEVFKKTLEADRNKVKQEMMARMSRIKTLEAEKQELLNETHELMMQMERGQRGVTEAKAEAEDAVKSLTQVNEQLDATKARNMELLSELKTMTRNEQQLKEEKAKSESDLKELILKLENEVKDNKKSSGKQIVDLNLQLKALFEEIEQHKKDTSIRMDNEKRLQNEIDQLKSTLEDSNRSSEDVHQQLSKEVIAMRKEIQESRMKSKIVSESKTKIEMELISVRLELSRSESEVQRQNEAIKVIEANTQTYINKLNIAHSEMEAMNELAKSLKHKVSELENNIQRKNEAIDELTKDIEHVEQESLADMRRLRLQLSNADQELNELRPMLAMLQKELGDSKAIVAKQHSSSNSAVNNLLEELRATEDALSKERKKALVESENHHAKLAELQNILDRSKETIEDLEAKAKSDKNDKEIRIMQLENEVERIKSSVISRDNRIDELEKQHQQNRQKMHEVKEKLDVAERQLTEAKNQSEVEIANRKRLEARLRAVSDKGGEENDGMLTSRSIYSRHGEKDRDRPYSSRRGMSAGETRDSGRLSHRDYSSTSNDEYHSSTNNIPSSNMRIMQLDTINSSQATPRRQVYESDDQLEYTGKYGKDDFGSPMSTMLSPQRTVTEHFCSPGNSPRSNAIGSTATYSYQHAAQSPVVDRVSQALAARAAAESSKNALKQAQQQARNAERQNINGDRSHQLIQYQHQQSNNILRRPSSGSDNTRRDNSDYNGYNDARMIADVEPVNSVEDTIMRAQMKINKKLAIENGKHESTNSSDPHTKRSPRGSARLNENIQLANLLYPNSDSQEINHERGDTAGVNITTPSLHPASPPKENYSERQLRASFDHQIDYNNNNEDDTVIPSAASYERIYYEDVDELASAFTAGAAAAAATDSGKGKPKRIRSGNKNSSSGVTTVKKKKAQGLGSSASLPKI